MKEPDAASCSSTKNFAQHRRADRDHRKIVVIDGREAFVGGHCIVDSWLGDAQAANTLGTSA